MQRSAVMKQDRSRNSAAYNSGLDNPQQKPDLGSCLLSEKLGRLSVEFLCLEIELLSCKSMLTVRKGSKLESEHFVVTGAPCSQVLVL